MDNSPFVELDFVIDFEIILCPKTFLGEFRSLGVWEFGQYPFFRSVGVTGV